MHFILLQVRSMAKHTIHCRNHSEINYWIPNQHPPTTEKTLKNLAFLLAYTNISHTTDPCMTAQKMPMRAFNLIPSS